MTDAEFMRDVLQRIATGPTLSKDLTRIEAMRAMQIILEQQADEVQAGIFLIALRMKRETDDELFGVLEAINNMIEPCNVAVSDLITIVDPYDGYLRSTPVAPFLPAVLAACGQKVLTHGVLSMGPKFGASHESVLRASGHSVCNTRAQAAEAIEMSSCGWAYLPQAVFAPALAALASLRTRIVKRPCLTTLEVAVNALSCNSASYLVTGFVHKPYPPIYANLAAQAGFSRSILIRGVEGGVVPSLTQAARYFCGTRAEDLIQTDLQPADIAIKRTERAVPLPELLSLDSVRSVRQPDNEFAKTLSKHAALVGMQALQGQSGYAADSLIYSASVILTALGVHASLADAAEHVRSVLQDGTAHQHFLARPSAVKDEPAL